MKQKLAGYAFFYFIGRFSLKTNEVRLTEIILCLDEALQRHHNVFSSNNFPKYFSKSPFIISIKLKLSFIPLFLKKRLTIKSFLLVNTSDTGVDFAWNIPDKSMLLIPIRRVNYRVLKNNNP